MGILEVGGIMYLESSFGIILVGILEKMMRENVSLGFKTKTVFGPFLVKTKTVIWAEIYLYIWGNEALVIWTWASLISVCF